MYFAHNIYSAHTSQHIDFHFQHKELGVLCDVRTHLGQLCLSPESPSKLTLGGSPPAMANTLFQQIQTICSVTKKGIEKNFADTNHTFNTQTLKLQLLQSGS